MEEDCGWKKSKFYMIFFIKINLDWSIIVQNIYSHNFLLEMTWVFIHELNKLSNPYVIQIRAWYNHIHLHLNVKFSYHLNKRMSYFPSLVDFYKYFSIYILYNKLLQQIFSYLQHFLHQQSPTSPFTDVATSI